MTENQTHAYGSGVKSSSESRSRERFARLLEQKKGPNKVIAVVLSVALLLGLLGFAVHLLWVAAVVVMALGLGFTLANSRRDRVDVTNQQAEDRSTSAETAQQEAHQAQRREDPQAARSPKGT